MSLDRRSLLRGFAGTAGGLLFSPQVWPQRAVAADPTRPPKRFVFFLQNHGFHPQHSQLDGTKISDKTLDKIIDQPLKGSKLPKFIDPLQPYLDRLTIVQGLNGKHIAPYHGAPYGALGGFKKEHSTPHGETIDCALSRVVPGVVPMLALGWETLQKMQSQPIHYASSAWSANKAVPMFCDPLLAYKNLFGVAKPGKDRDDFETETDLYDFARRGASQLQSRLPQSEQDKFRPYLEGHEEAGKRRRELLKMADQLAKYAPVVNDKFHKPQFETDWWDASLSVGIGSLASGATNVLTIASGLCTVGGSWTGWGATTVGHTLGHTSQLENPDWLKIRRSSLEMVVRIAKALEAVPEGKGTMLDNTLIVYSSCAGEAQHSTGNRWPFLLLGNLGGTLRTGRYLHYPLEPHAKSRTVNALYTTLLHASGAPRDRFNLEGALKDLDRAGPLPELLA
jgi:hypothetical protein